MRRLGFLGLTTLGALCVFPACGATDASVDAVAIGQACDRWIMDLGEKGPLFDAILVPGGTNDAGREVVDIRSLSPQERALVLAAYRRACVDVTTVEGSRADAAYIDRCREALAGFTGQGAIPLACVPPPGAHEDGAGCVADHQCASLHCAGGSAFLRTCGVCAPALRDDASCQTDCGFGYYCGIRIIPGAHSGPSLCSPRAIFKSGPPLDPCRGVTCSAGQYCDPSSGACTASRAEGEPCASETECASGRICPSGRCVAPNPLGSPCVADIYCATDAYCKPAPSDRPPGDGTTPGTCTKAPALGEPCDGWDVQCGRQQPGTDCGAPCDGPTVCRVLQSDAPLTPPNQTTMGTGCVFYTGYNEVCGQCPSLADDGEPCGPGAACGPRSACINGTCQFVRVGCQ